MYGAFSKTRRISQGWGRLDLVVLALGVLLAWHTPQAGAGEAAGAQDDATDATPWRPIKAPPGPEYADSTRMFQGIPGIERAPNGRFWATWYGGGIGETHDNYVMLATRGPEDNEWSDIKLVIDPDGGGPIRAFDPCLWMDPLERLWLFWAQEVVRAYGPS